MNIRPYIDQALAWAKTHRAMIFTGIVVAICGGAILIGNVGGVLKDARTRQAAQTCLQHGKNAVDRSKAAQTPADIQEAMRYQSYILHECNIAMGREKP